MNLYNDLFAERAAYSHITLCLGGASLGRRKNQGSKWCKGSIWLHHSSNILYMYYIWRLLLHGPGLCHANYAVQSQESHFCNLLQRAPSSVAKIIARKSGIQERRVLFFRPRGETTTCHNLKAQDFQVSKDFQRLSETFKNFQILSETFKVFQMTKEKISMLKGDNQASYEPFF